jgi:hypothetical protein
MEGSVGGCVWGCGRVSEELGREYRGDTES